MYTYHPVSTCILVSVVLWGLPCYSVILCFLVKVLPQPQALFPAFSEREGPPAPRRSTLQPPSSGFRGCALIFKNSLSHTDPVTSEVGNHPRMGRLSESSLAQLHGVVGRAPAWTPGDPASNSSPRGDLRHLGRCPRVKHMGQEPCQVLAVPIPQMTTLTHGDGKSITMDSSEAVRGEQSGY